MYFENRLRIVLLTNTNLPKKKSGRNRCFFKSSIQNLVHRVIGPLKIVWG